MACRRFRSWLVIAAIVALSAVASVPMVHAAPLSEAATASGGTVPQSGNCPAGRQQDEHCLPGGPGSPPAGPGGPIHPPVTPPVMPPVVPPSGRLPVTRPQDPELPLIIIGRAKAILHIHDADQDVTYTSGRVQLAFLRSYVQDMPGNTQYAVIPYPGAEGTTTWNASGRVFDCIVEGKAVIPVLVLLTDSPYGVIPIFPGIDLPIDPSRPAFGYLNVVGPDGATFIV